MNLQKIKTCASCELRSLITNFFESKNDYLNFTYYFSDEHAKSAKFMIVLQNPGEINRKKNREVYSKLLKVSEDESFIKIQREELLKYMHDNQHFFPRFIALLKKSNLISYSYKKDDPGFDYIFLKDFIVSDAVKCRATTENIKESYIIECTNKYLFKEIELYGQNKLIFVFSTRAWRAVYCKFFNPENNNDKVAKVHGRLFYHPGLKSYFIPLAHFSKNSFNHMLRNSYLDYLEEGLSEYKEKCS
jgi:hypothetical protein